MKAATVPRFTKETVFMKKNTRFTLKDYTDIKIFLLFLLDNIRYPIDYTTLSKILIENIELMSFDYEQCLAELTDDGHILYDELDGERYFMISDTGKNIAAELYETLDEDFRENTVRCAAKYISLSRSGTEISSRITEDESKGFKVTLAAKSPDRGEFFKLSLNVSTRAEAEQISRNFEQRPEGFYRGVLFCATGKFEFLS